MWVFARSYSDPKYGQDIVSRWGTLAIVILALLALLAVDSVLCFHFYLVFFLRTTTLDYILNQPDSEP